MKKEVSIAQAAKILGVSRQCLHKHYKDGHFSGRKDGGIIFVIPEQVKRELCLLYENKNYRVKIKLASEKLVKN